MLVSTSCKTRIAIKDRTHKVKVLGTWNFRHKNETLVSSCDLSRGDGTSPASVYSQTVFIPLMRTVCALDNQIKINQFNINSVFLYNMFPRMYAKSICPYDTVF